MGARQLSHQLLVARRCRREMQLGLRKRLVGERLGAVNHRLGLDLGVGQHLGRFALTLGQDRVGVGVGRSGPLLGLLDRTGGLVAGVRGSPRRRPWHHVPVARLRPAN